MKSVIVLILLSASTLAYPQSRQPSTTDPWRLETSPGISPSREREIEMRPRFDPDPTNRYRGTIDRDGDTRMRNLDGDTMRGNIDRDGYGRLRDSDGNSYRIRPR